MHIKPFLITNFNCKEYISNGTNTNEKYLYTFLSSLVSFASTDNILSVLRSILVVLRTQPIEDAVLIFADGEYMLLSASGDLLRAR